MGLLISKPKLKAATRSMHQFCPVVRGVFPEEPPDDVVEAATFFLYSRLANDVFGKRFTTMLDVQLREHFRFAPAVEIDARARRIALRVDQFRRMSLAMTNVDEFTTQVHSVIKALLAEADLRFEDAELVLNTVPRFEAAVRRLREHLEGIKRQSHFMMK